MPAFVRVTKWFAKGRGPESHKTTPYCTGGVVACETDAAVPLSMLTVALVLVLPLSVGIMHIMATRDPVNLKLADAPRIEVECIVPVHDASEVINTQSEEYVTAGSLSSIEAL